MADSPSTDKPVESSTSTNDQTVAEPRQHKRTRAAMDPGTPKGEEGETAKGLTSSTPVAKKGRVEGDDDEEDGSETGRTTPPSAETDGLPPVTPATAATTSSTVPGTEGKETKHIRERVAAMKASSNHSNSNNKDPQGSAEGNDKEMKAAETAAEVSVTAAKLGDQQEAKEEKDTEIAEVAAEVGKSAELVNGTEEVKPVAKSTSFVPFTGKPSTSATPNPAPASGFSTFSSSSSPFASVSTPAKPSPLPSTPAAPTDTQKPKTKTAFSASPFLASSIPLAKKSEPASSSSSTASSSTPAPSTPASKPLSSNSPFSAFASTSGFAASAAKKPSALGSSSSVFGTPSGKSAFSSYSAAPSAFASVPSTPAAKSPLPPSASSTSTAATAEDSSSTTTTTNKEDAAEQSEGSNHRKIGEPEEVDENKRVYTERETHTGEEGDKVVHNVRAKLFAMQDGNWVERGMGPLKVNLTKKDGEGEKDGARIVMRADATHRLLLNSPLFKEFFIEVSNEKYVRFTIIEGSEPISYMARLGNPAAAEALVAAIRERTSAL